VASGELHLFIFSFGTRKIAPIVAYDVADVRKKSVEPEARISRSYELTGPELKDMYGFADDYAVALGRTVGTFRWTSLPGSNATSTRSLQPAPLPSQINSRQLCGIGVLDGRRATTHWQAAEDFARRYPSVKVEAQALFVEKGSLWTPAGVSMGIDMALAVVGRDLGAPGCRQCRPPVGGSSVSARTSIAVFRAIRSTSRALRASHGMDFRTPGVRPRS
jgi:hypothetical protein